MFFCVKAIKIILVGSGIENNTHSGEQQHITSFTVPVILLVRTKKNRYQLIHILICICIEHGTINAVMLPVYDIILSW